MRNQSASIFIVFALSFLVLMPFEKSNAASLDISGKCNIVLSGTIDEFTERDLETRYNALNNRKPQECKTVILLLNSEGGDVDAALKAGTFVRQKKITTVVAQGTSCSSACSLLLLGGVDRYSAGRIGLHRPYSTKYSVSEREAQKTYDSINQRIIQYLKIMNIPESLLNIMNSIAPDSIRWMTFKELQEMQICGVDPVYAEQKDSLKAQRLQITKQEYYARKKQASNMMNSCVEKLDNTEEFIRCENDIKIWRTKWLGDE